MIAHVLTFILFFDIIFAFCYSCISRAKYKSFEVPKRQLMKKRPIPSASINTKIGYIDTESSLARMVADLTNADELAVDSEVRG